MTDTEPAVVQPPPPWGYWATGGWVLLAAVLSAFTGLAAMLTWWPELLEGSTDILKDGRLISVTTAISAVVEIAVLAFAAHLARWPVADYLALTRPSRSSVIVAFAILIPFLLAYDALNYVLDKDIVSPFQVDTYRSAKATHSLVLLWFTFVVAAPVSEEIIFRGFLFRGWVRSPRSAWPGILIISALFAIIHVQYDWFGILQVFCVGVLLAWTRWASGSTVLTMMMHATINTWATLQTVAKVEWMS